MQSTPCLRVEHSRKLNVPVPLKSWLLARGEKPLLRRRLFVLPCPFRYFLGLFQRVQAAGYVVEAGGYGIKLGHELFLLVCAVGCVF